MQIESFDRNVDQLLRMGYFKIPRFQRPYSWERTETEDFWNDTIADSESEYFIGSIVVFKYSEALYGIVDGQQRLTTLTMLLSSIRDELAKEGFADLATGLHQLIERPDFDNKNQFVLQSESSYPYLQHSIQTYPHKDEETTNTDEETRLKEAYEFICLNLKETVEAIRRDKTSSEEKKQQSIKEKLQDVRDKILRLKLIIIVLQNEEDAYLIFETLNTRGKDLTVSDMVRTHITRLLPQKNRNVDRPKERFNQIVEGFELSEAEINMSSFLHHYWLSRYEYTTEKKLYKAIKKEIRTRESTKEFLESLEEDASRYRTIHEPASRKWRIEQQVLRESLEALNLFRVRQQIPFVLSVLGEYEEGNLSLKQATRALKAVEHFHFAFTAVTSQRSSGGISLMYALHARQLRKAKSAHKKANVIEQLVAKLRLKRPVYQEFEANFRNIGFSEKFTKRKSLVQYILGRMYSHYMPHQPINFDLMTIEHLESQSLARGSSFSDADVSTIGNLLFVSEKLNGKLKRKAFNEKMGLLKSSAIWMDDFLSQQDKWTPELIQKRSDFLAKMAYKRCGHSEKQAVDVTTKITVDGVPVMSSKTNINPRELMELAIEVMRQSVREPRADGKAGPKIGAVLVFPDGTAEARVRQTRFLQSGTCKKRCCRTMDFNAEKQCEEIA